MGRLDAGEFATLEVQNAESFRRSREGCIQPGQHFWERHRSDDRSNGAIADRSRDSDSDHQSSSLIAAGRHQPECRSPGPWGGDAGHVGGRISDPCLHHARTIDDGNGTDESGREIQDGLEVLSCGGNGRGPRVRLKRGADRGHGRHGQHGAADILELTPGLGGHVRTLRVQPLSLGNAGIVEDRSGQGCQRGEWKDRHRDQRQGKPNFDRAKAVTPVAEFIERCARVWWIALHEFPGGMKTSGPCIAGRGACAHPPNVPIGYRDCWWF